MNYPPKHLAKLQRTVDATDFLYLEREFDFYLGWFCINLWRDES